jgi:uncharacterized protein (TIGR02611 family)
MRKIKDAWWRVPTAIRKPLVFIFGFAIVGAGLIMLITPGPGWAGIFIGFAILATEFAFAEKVRDQLVTYLKLVMEKLKQLWRNTKHRFKRKHK